MPDREVILDEEHIHCLCFREDIRIFSIQEDAHESMSLHKCPGQHSSRYWKLILTHCRKRQLLGETRRSYFLKYI